MIKRVIEDCEKEIDKNSLNYSAESVTLNIKGVPIELKGAGLEIYEQGKVDAFKVVKELLKHKEKYDRCGECIEHEFSYEQGLLEGELKGRSDVIEEFRETLSNWFRLVGSDEDLEWNRAIDKVLEFAEQLKEK